MSMLFINHKKAQCGVYEFGRNIGLALEKSSRKFSYHECNSEAEFQAVVKKEQPALIIYNYHPSTMPWVNVKLTKKIGCPQIGIIHEVTQQVADRADNSLFNFHIAHDPTLLLKNPLVFKAGRLIPAYENRYPPPAIPTIGSFGFGTGGKGFEKIVELVQGEFDEATIRFNIAYASFGDADGANARRIAENCRELLTKPNIKLEISHDFLEQSQVLDFLARNTINLFLYEEQGVQRGISSVTDLALAVQRPIALSFNSMFRHLLGAKPSVCVADNSIRQIIENGMAGLERYYREWSEEVLCWEYERITENVLARSHIPRIYDPSRIRRTLGRAKRFIKGQQVEAPVRAHSWISDTSFNKLKTTASKKLSYRPSAIPGDWSLNNILDDRARGLYQGTIEQMFDYLPDLMKRKIPEANVQQAFVLDTVYKIVSRIDSPKILCVGSFEDSACESLKMLGFEVEQIDPMVNYDLSAFMTKPTTIKDSYDVVFSTSVIEHVEHDEQFLLDIAALLKKGGEAVLTCDYCDTYKQGDPKPAVDFRFYTQKDIKERLLKRVADCRLVGEPQWDCPNPDFYFEGFNYTFASIVLKKDSI
jgi:SAM-dependent methyltransferase